MLSTIKHVTNSIRLTLRALAAGILVCALGAALSGCLSGDAVPVSGANGGAASDLPLPLETASVGSTPAASTSAIPNPTASAATGIIGLATGLTCDDVLSADDLYALKGGANIALNTKATPAAGSMAARLVSLKGIACVYVNESSGEKFTVGLARPSASSMPLVTSSIEREQGSSYRVPSFSVLTGAVGYFRVYNGIGLASVATPTYWYSVSSTTFDTSVDARQIVQLVQKSLGK